MEHPQSNPIRSKDKRFEEDKRQEWSQQQVLGKEERKIFEENVDNKMTDEEDMGEEE